jgi:hypothetical protein
MSDDQRTDDVGVTLPRQEVALLLALLARTPFPTPEQKMLAASAQGRPGAPASQP